MASLTWRDLKKDTISESYQYLNRLLKDVSGEDYERLRELVKRSSRLDPFLQSIKMIIIDSLELKEEVIKALLSDDIQESRRALQCSWFFKTALEPEFYQSNILPEVSFSTRCKIISQLAKNMESTDHAEQLFKFVKANYGSRYAEPLLARCSEKFVQSYIADSKPFFHYNNSVRTIINISKRYGNADIILSALDVIFNEDHPCKDNMHRYNGLLLYLAKNHLAIFLLFFKKHYASINQLNFGHKLTRILTTHLTDLICQCDENLINKFHETTLFKSLAVDNQIRYLINKVRPKGKGITLKRWINVLPDLINLLKKEPEIERLHIFETVFNKVYNQSIWDDLSIWSLQFLELMPLDIRERCVATLSAANSLSTSMKKWYSENHCIDPDRSISERLLYLLRCDKSIPELKAIAAKSPVLAKRKVIIDEMLRSCAVNKDFAALEKVCEYIVSRHRNDDLSLIMAVVRSVTSSFNCLKLSKSTWSLLEEIGVIMVANQEGVYDYEELMRRHFRFLLKNNLDIKPHVKTLIKLCFSRLSYARDFHALCHSKEIFFILYDELFEIIRKEPEQDIVLSLVLSIVMTASQYNSKYTKDKIALHDLKLFIDQFDLLLDDARLLDNYEYYFTNYMLKYPPCRDRYALRYINKSFKWKNVSEEFLLYILKKYPFYFIDNLENTLELLFAKRYLGKELMSSKKYFAFFGLSEKIREIAQRKVESDDLIHKRTNALEIYSRHSSIEEYTKLIQAYIPSSDKIDYTKSEEDILALTLLAPNLIRHIKPDSMNFPLISKYLKGDYLKPVLGSFNSAWANTPAQDALIFLKQHTDTPVSVRKNVLRGISEITPIPERLPIFYELWSKEKHYSIRFVILQSLSKSFLENPNDETFEMVKKCILECDELTIEGRPSFVPASYFSQYAEILWQFSNNLGKEKDQFRYNFQNALINNFNLQNIRYLSNEFCKSVLQNHLFQKNSELKPNQFSCWYLLSDSQSITEKLKWLITVMTGRKQNRKLIVLFLVTLEQTSLSYIESKKVSYLNPQTFYEVFDLLARQWSEIFTENELFDAHLIIKYYSLYLSLLREFPEPSAESSISLSIKFAKEVKRIIVGVSNHSELFLVFSTTLLSFLNDIKNAKVCLDKALITKCLLTETETRSVVLCGLLLTPEAPENEEEIDDVGDTPDSLDADRNWKHVRQILRSSKDDVVQIYFNRATSSS